MRLLLVTPFLPDVQASHGGGLYLGTLATALSRRAELGLVALVGPGEGERAAASGSPFRWAATLPRQERPARRGLGLGGHRARMLLRWGLHRRPLVAAKTWDPRLRPLLQRARAEFAPDAALVELVQMAQFLPWLEGVPAVLTDHECGVPGNARTELGPWADRRDRRLWEGYVDRYYPRADLLQAVTEEDAAELRLRFGREVAVRPPVLPVAALPVDVAAAPPRALFLGDYAHGPNPEAARRLVRDVLPKLRAGEPRAELWLAGPNSDRLDGLAAVPGVRVVGFAAKLPELFAQVRLMLAPLWSGGGFRMKSLSALAHGVPVVTNALGARGAAAPPPARAIAETPDDLANAALALLRSPQLAAEAGRVAHAWAKANLDADAVAGAQLARVDALLRR